jgi:mono/diheme cytochrome c family protein
MAILHELKDLFGRMTRLPILLLLFGLPLAAQSNGDSTRLAAGVYTEAQAARGDTVYKSYCSSCHETSFHTDAQFRFNWFGRTVYDLFKILKTTMPEDNVGGLSDDQYTNVIAYILKLNGFAAGTDSLRADSLEMKRIRITPAATDSVKPNR